MDNKIEQLAKILRESENIVFFGGAGMSTEYGNKVKNKKGVLKTLQLS